MQEIVVQPRHVELFKKHRFFTGWFPTTRAYLESRDGIGWFKVGLKLQFRQRIAIEPYSAIYAAPYRAGMGQASSHGLCTIGTQSYSHSALPEAMEVGRYCSIGAGLAILDSQHPHHFISTAHFAWRPQSAFVAAAYEDRGIAKAPKAPPFDLMAGKRYPVIGNDVWIGQNVTLSPGIFIGDGAVIAANSTVTKTVAPYMIVGGNPAKPIRLRFAEHLVDRFMRSRWWESCFIDFADLPMDKPADFLDGLELRRPAKFEPELLVLPDALQPES